MNTYYTAKDIEELAANGTKQLVLAPGVFLTDYARETALQLGIELVRNETKVQTQATNTVQRPAACLPGTQAVVNNKYSKPRGCQHHLTAQPVQVSNASKPSGGQSKAPGNPNNTATVNDLIDLMGKVIKRGS